MTGRHPVCWCGCGELADECAGPRKNPWGALQIVSAAPEPTTLWELFAAEEEQEC